MIGVKDKPCILFYKKLGAETSIEFFKKIY